MSTEQHPLMVFLNATGETLTDFAKRTNMSRMQIYRIMNGEGTTTASLKKISAATDGRVSVTDFIEHSEAAQ